MPYLNEFITVAVIHLLAVASPGPDFVMITRNSLVYSRKTGVYSAVGLGLGMMVHIAYCLIGIGFLISQSILLFNIVKFMGAAYLIWIGMQSIRAKKQAAEDDEKSVEGIMEVVAEKDMSVRGAIWMGFLTNVLNPKATLFFLSLFTQVIDPATPLIIQMLYGLEMVVAGIAWFSILSLFFSQSRVKARFMQIGHYIERAMGAVLVALGIKVALSANK